MIAGSLAMVVKLAAVVFWLLIVGRVIVSWIDPRARSGASRMIVQLTEPFLAPIRSLMPRTGMVDLSPLVVMLVLGLVLRAVV